MGGRSIRRAARDDATAIAAVYRSAYRRNRELGFPAKAASATATTVRKWIEEDRVYVATADDRIVGSVRLEETDPERAKLSRLGVHADWKRRGIGSELLDHVESVASEDGYQRLWLTTPEGHPFLPEFYRSRGYGRTGEYPLDYREYDEVIMEKRLQG